MAVLDKDVKAVLIVGEDDAWQIVETEERYMGFSDEGDNKDDAILDVEHRTIACDAIGGGQPPQGTKAVGEAMRFAMIISGDDQHQSNRVQPKYPRPLLARLLRQFVEDEFSAEDRKRNPLVSISINVRNGSAGTHLFIDMHTGEVMDPPEA